jgi:DNA polymerase-1
MQITIAEEQYEVVYTEDPWVVSDHMRQDRPVFFSYDTETTGLHIKKDRPFLGAVCYDNVVFVFPTTPDMLQALIRWSTYVERVYCHNTTYDMHMTANIIGDEEVLKVKNWGDTMGLCRLSFESRSARDGGDSLGLKKVAAKYIDVNADKYEKEVKAWLKGCVKENNKLLTAFLKPLKWSYSKLEKALKAEEEIPQEVLDIQEQWKRDYPEPTYQDVPREIMIPYLAVDVILTKILVKRASVSVEKKGQLPILLQEFELIPVIFKMERVGFKVDRAYLEKCRIRVEEEIKKVTKRAHEIAGFAFTSGQHQVIKSIYQAQSDEAIGSTDKKFLKNMGKSGDELAPLITRWRTLDKWLSTYICRILEGSEYDGRLYTTLGQFNPVSGRFSGDAQQFPKKAIYTEEGLAIIKAGQKPGEEHELFHPRRAITVSGDGYNSTYYLDFSQVELRVQAHYTIPFGGDFNLCRAYMPFNCTHHITGDTYDFRSIEGRKRWREFKEDAPVSTVHWEDLLKQGYSVWIMPETGTPWMPTDVHSATTIKALKLLGMDHTTMEEALFQMWRGTGKTFNFMRNYGGGAAMAAEVLDITMEEAEAMANGYTQAFPLVIDYQNHVIKTMYARGYVRNLSGRRYYIDNDRSYYKCANYLIQGSCADDLKAKMIKIDRWLMENNCRSRMVMCIHDEIQYEVWDGEEWIIPFIKDIMEYTPDVLVPIVSDIEKTTGVWADKKKVIGI